MARAEIGIEWVDDYNGRAPDLLQCEIQSEAFYNRLDGVRVFNWGDDLAWDQDFEEEGAGKPSDGTDTFWVDDVDIVYYAGHGSPDGPFFGDDDHDDGEAGHKEVRLGNGDLEWIVFDACRVLRKKKDYYYNCWDMFRGLHYMLGWHSDANDEPDRGEVFADYLNSGDRIRNAWIWACEETAPSDLEWAYLRADDDDSNTYNDHWFDKGYLSPDPKPLSQELYYLKGSC